MKKTKEKKVRQKMPKKLRFSRFFLRRLIPCVLAGGIAAGIMIQAAYNDYDDFSTTYKEGWDKLINEQFQRNGDAPSSAEEAMEKEGLSGVLRNLYHNYDVVTHIYKRYLDYSALLLDPETGEYVISEPVADLCTVRYDPDSKTRIYKSYYASPEEAEQLANEVLEYTDRHYWRFYLPAAFGCISLFNQGGSLERWMDAHYVGIEATRAYIKDNSFTNAEYGWDKDGKELHDVVRHDAALTEEWREVTSPNYIMQDGKYVPNEEPAGENTLTETEEILYLAFYGYPANCRAGRLMRGITDDLDYSISFCLEKIREMQEIIDDKSGEKRYQYYREAYDEKVAEMKSDSELVQNGYEPYYNPKLDIPTPEEELEHYRRNLKQFPEHYIQSAVTEQETVRQYKKEHIRTFMHTWDVEINERTYTLFCIDTVDVPLAIRPTCIMLACQFLTVAVLISLIWALISYLRARRKYEMDEYRRSLTAALAHDLKSPLTAISGYAENLSSGVHPEKQAHYSDSILEGTQYMDNIITNVLELSRLEKTAGTKKKRVDLIALAQEVHANREDEITARALNLQITGSCTVHADPLMMTQAIRNLLDNAVKFTPDGGRITVTGENRTLRIVNDIAEDKIEHVEQLCEAFVKGDSARSNRKGTGLGLSVVRQIAELNKLRFGIESSGHKFSVQIQERPSLLRGIRTKKQNRKNA